MWKSPENVSFSIHDKNGQNWTFNFGAKIQMNVARFARNVVNNESFLRDFQPLWCYLHYCPFLLTFLVATKSVVFSVFSAFYSQQRPFCGKWRSKNGLRMLSMAKRLGSMSLNSPIVKQGRRKFWKSWGPLVMWWTSWLMFTRARESSQARVILLPWSTV